MNDRLEMLLEKFRTLERELAMELQKKQDEFFYQVHKKKVRFQRGIKLEHRLMMKGVFQYLRESRPLVILTLPVIWYLPGYLFSHLRYPKGVPGRLHSARPTQPELFECY
jgi:hypothetical protein